MRPFLLLLACFTSIHLFAQPPFHRIAPVPSWVEALPIEGLSIKDTACSRGGTEYLLVDRQFHLGEDRHHHRMVMRLTTSEAVQQNARFQVDVDPAFQQVDLHHVRIIRDGKVLEQLEPQSLSVLQRERDMHAFLYDGTRTVVLELHDVRPGDIVDQAYTIKGTDPSRSGRFTRSMSTGFSVTIARHRLRFIVPDGREPRFLRHRFEEPAHIMRKAGHTEHVWDMHDAPCLEDEGGHPSWYRPWPELQVSEYGDVEELRRWAITQFDVDMRLGGGLEREVAAIARIPEPMRRIDSAFHFVQRQVRYLGLEDGISAYRPRPPAKVYAQRFGDCKDRSLMLVAMLRAMDIRAWPALVNTEQGLILDQMLPRPGLFDHCIVLLEHEGEQYWLDPTRSHGRGELPRRYIPDLGLALVVDPGFTGWQRMGTDQLGSVQVTETFIVDDIGGGATLEVLSRYAHREADRVRGWLLNQSIAEITAQYRDFYLSTYGEGEVLEPVKVDDHEEENVLQVRELYKLERVWDTLPSGQLQLSVHGKVLQDYVEVPALRTRTTPYALGLPVEVKQTVHVYLPEPWDVDIDPVEIKGYGVRYFTSITSEGSHVLMELFYRSDSTVVHPQDMAAFQAQQRRIVDDIGFSLTYGAGGTLPGWRKVLAYAGLFGCCLLGIWAAFRLHEWDPEPHPDSLGQPHTGIGGWMVLPMIGLVLSPLFLLRDMLSEGAWFFTAGEHVQQLVNDGWFPYLIYAWFAQANGLLMFFVVIVTIVLFFKRRSNVPRIMLGIYLLTVAFHVIDMSCYALLDFEGLTGEVYDGRDLGRAIFSAIIWVPFFLFSSRVRTTFVMRKHGYSLPPSQP